MAHAAQATDTDAQLVAQAQQGDTRSFDLLVLKYQHRVIALIRRFVKNEAEAEDLAQETFIKAFRALPNFRGDSQFYTWLYRIAVNTAKNSLEVNKRRPSSDVDIDEIGEYAFDEHLQQQDTPENMLASEDMQRVVSEALAALSDDLRRALMLREFDGLSYEAIAQAMGCPIGTVRSRIFRAREAIDAVVRPLLEQ